MKAPPENLTKPAPDATEFHRYQYPYLGLLVAAFSLSGPRAQGTRAAERGIQGIRNYKACHALTHLRVCMSMSISAHLRTTSHATAPEDLRQIDVMRCRPGFCGA